MNLSLVARQRPQLPDGLTGSAASRIPAGAQVGTVTELDAAATRPPRCNGRCHDS